MTAEFEARMRKRAASLEAMSQNADVPRIPEDAPVGDVAWQRIVAEAEWQQRRSAAFERLAAILTDCNSDDLLPGLLAILIDTARLDVGVIRLREGEELRARAALGLEEEVARGFSLPVVAALPALVSAQHASSWPWVVPPDDHCRSQMMRDKGIRTLYCLPFYEADELLGAAYLGSPGEHAASESENELLTALGRCITAALSKRTAHMALEQAVRSRDQVLAVVAHDLRNPIGVITLAADTLHKRLTDSALLRPIERITRAALRAERLISDLLAIDAIEGGRLSIETRRVDTAHVILAALESQQSLAANANVIIATDLSPELPELEGDEERLLEVLENLVDNAVKFTPAGGSITVGASRADDDILVWVKDSGSGIAPEQMPHLFDRFWQAKKKDRRGTGLGLTICKAIVEAHGGRIWAESTPGAGTTLFFTIPAQGAARVEPRSSDVAGILLVDDRPENLLALRTILERPEYRLVSARSGAEALSLALRERLSVALIDIAMPGMNGLEVAAHLKGLERSRDIPIIFITAFGDDPDEIHRAYSAGGADYLVKPLDPEIVRKKVAVFVELNRKRLTAPARSSR